MIDFRETIREELERQGRTATWLSEQEGTPVRNTIYRFLAAKNPIDVTSEPLAAMLTALGVNLTMRPQVRKNWGQGEEE